MDGIGFNSEGTNTKTEDLTIIGKMEIKGVDESIKDVKELQDAITKYQKVVKGTVWTRIIERFVVKFTSTKFIIAIVSLVGTFYCMINNVVPVKEGLIVISMILGGYGLVNLNQKKMENQNGQS